MFSTATDRTLTCVDCRQEFAFTASEQQFYADRQFSEPRRCAWGFRHRILQRRRIREPRL